MEKLSRFILKHKAVVLSVMVALIVLACVGLMFVKTNSDIQSYLPDDSMTAQGRDELNEKYGIQGDSTLVVKGADETFLKKFLADTTAKDFVTQVAWIGSFDMIKVQLDDPNLPAMEREILEKSYATAQNKYILKAKDGTVIHLINIYYNKSSTDKVVMNYLDEIDDVLTQGAEDGKIAEYAMGGMASNARDMLKSSLGEIPIYLVIAVVILSVILLLTTKSFLEPLIFLATLGIALLLNMGSNVLFGAISTITYSASTILQLALAMDYSIFLMHCYYEEKAKSPLIDAKTAMLQAMPKTFKSVAASALTTMGGFIALFAMEFKMGIDLGAVLAKGVLLSLLTVMFLQPILILALNKPIERTTHKFIKPQLKRTQKFATKFYKPIVIVACLLVIPSLVGQFMAPLSYLTMTKPQQIVSETQELIGNKSNQLIVITPQNVPSSIHYDFLEKVENLDGIENAFSAYSLIPADKFALVAMFRPELMAELGKTFFKSGYSLYIFELNVGVESDECYATIDEITSFAEKNFGKGKAYITGLGQGAKDLAAVTPKDFIVVSLLSALIILLILILTYKEFLLPLIMLLVIELGIWINLSLVTLIGVDINFMSYLIISSVQLGATVDYAILAVSKYKQVKGEGERDEGKAICEGIRRASPSIIVSAFVLVTICIAVFFVTSNKIIAEITLLIAAGALMSTFLVMVLLPAILMMKSDIHKRRNNKRIKKFGLPCDGDNITLPQFIAGEDESITPTQFVAGDGSESVSLLEAMVENNIAVDDTRNFNK